MEAEMKRSETLNFVGRKVLVVGLGISGLWTARWLIHQGARVTVSDTRPESDLDPSWCRELRESSVILETGGHTAQTFMDSETIVISPGVPHRMQLLLDAKAEGIPVIGELELAGRFVDAPIIAVTGTTPFGSSSISIICSVI